MEKRISLLLRKSSQLTQAWCAQVAKMLANKMCNYAGLKRHARRSSQKQKCHAITIFSLAFNSGPLPARVNCGSYTSRERGILHYHRGRGHSPWWKAVTFAQTAAAEHNEAARECSMEFLSEASGPLQHTPHIYKYTLSKVIAHLPVAHWMDGRAFFINSL